LGSSIFEWIVTKKPNSYKPKKNSFKNGNSKEAKRLRCCSKCNKVWEIGINGKFSIYENMPTYKLPRKKCRLCI